MSRDKFCFWKKNSVSAFNAAALATAISLIGCATTPSNRGADQGQTAAEVGQTSAHGMHEGNAEEESLPLFEGLGNHHYPITTSNPEAQSYFNQGLILAYSFNHAQAKRSFLEGAKRDASCAMCHWGAAYALGPNINAPMSPEAEAEAVGHIKEAEAASSSQKERDFISAMAERYGEPAGEDRADRDQAYADAMGKLAEKYPEDPEAATLWAEAMMVQHPWDYWEKSGEARPWTANIVRTLEDTIRKFPDHAGAHHFYVHAMEASRSPEKAVESADKLNTLVPAAGHLVHMPAHIYIRVGRYQDAINANLAAIEADKRQVAQSPGLYAMMYKPHNHHFLWAAATLAGRKELALKAARDTAEYMRDHEMEGNAMELMKQHFQMAPLLSEVRFGLWQKILERGAPLESAPPYEQGMLAYARAVALAKTGNEAGAAEEIRRLDRIRSRPELEGQMVMFNSLKSLLDIAWLVADAERLSAAGKLESAAVQLEKAKMIEDGLTYAEPSDWHHPVRQILGRVYLEAKQPRKALLAYEEDLQLFPFNVWSSTGIAQTYDALGDSELAAQTRERLRRQEQAIKLPASSY